MYRLLSATLVCVCICTHLGAQQNCELTLKAQVVEAHNFEPLFPAQAYVDELGKSFATDEQGRFTIEHLCPGTYTVHLQAVGYETRAERIDFRQSTDIKFRLPHLAQALKEVVATEERNPTVIQSKETLKKADIAAQSGKNLADLLQSVNGVTTFSNGATIAKPVIHGLSGNRILMLNNGVRQEDQQWGGEHAPNIDPFLANTVTVIKGAAGVRYGTDALGGVILVEPAQLRSQPGWNGEVNLAGFSNNRMGVASGMVEHRFTKTPALAFRVQGTVKKGGNYQLPSGKWAANTGISETNFSGDVGWRKAHWGAELFYSHFSTNLGLYRGSHTGNQADLLNAINSPDPLIPANFTYGLERPRQHVVHDMLKAKAYADTRLGLWTATYAYQHNFRQEYDVLRTENGKAQLNLTLNTQTFNLNLDHKAIGPLTGQVGVDGIAQSNRFADGDRLFIPFYDGLGGAAYAIERYKHTNWTVEGGLRYDYRYYHVLNPEGASQQVVTYNFNYSSVSGTLAFRQQLKPDWNWSATLSNAWRAPQASELFSGGLHQGAARVEIGNKYLNPERSYNLNLETERTWNNKFSLNLSLYQQYIQNYIYLEPGPDLLTIRGYFKTFTYQQTNATLSGADATVGYQWNPHLSSNLKASFLRAWDRTAKDWLILMPADRLSGSVKYTHDLGRLKNAFAGVNGHYVFQQKRIPSIFDQIDYPRPPAAYFLLGAEVGATVPVHQYPVQLSLSVDNALNARYRDYMDAFRYFIDRPGRDVVLRVRIPFNHDSKTKTPS